MEDIMLIRSSFMAFAKKHASGDICGDWECKMISEWTT